MFLRKIQKISDSKKRIIFWTILIVVAIILFSFWIKNFNQKIKNFQSQKFIEDLNIKKVGDAINSFPNPKQDLEKVGGLINEVENQQIQNTK